MGILEGFNPLALAAVLVFIIFLSSVGQTQKQAVIAGFGVIASALLINFLAVMGLWDSFYTKPGFVKIDTIANFVLALYLTIVGFLNFIDWARYKKQNDDGKFIIKLPIFLMVTNRTQAIIEKKLPFHQALAKNMFLIICSILVGAALTLLSSSWPKDFHALINYYGYYTSGQTLKAYVSLGVNSLGYVLPLIFVWGLFLFIGRSKALNSWMVHALSFIKIVSSAFCLSSGLGLLYILFKTR